MPPINIWLRAHPGAAIWRLSLHSPFLSLFPPLLSPLALKTSIRNFPMNETFGSKTFDQKNFRLEIFRFKSFLFENFLFKSFWFENFRFKKFRFGKGERGGGGGAGMPPRVVTREYLMGKGSGGKKRDPPHVMTRGRPHQRISESNLKLAKPLIIVSWWFSNTTCSY